MYIGRAVSGRRAVSVGGARLELGKTEPGRVGMSMLRSGSCLRGTIVARLSTESGWCTTLIRVVRWSGEPTVRDPASEQAWMLDETLSALRNAPACPPSLVSHMPKRCTTHHQKPSARAFDVDALDADKNKKHAERKTRKYFKRIRAAPVTVYPLPKHSPDDCLARRTDDERLLQLRLAKTKTRPKASGISNPWSDAGAAVVVAVAVAQATATVVL